MSYYEMESYLKKIMRRDSRKVAIVGLGKVGMTAAYALTLEHAADELVLISRSMEKVEGEKLDLEHGLSFLESTKIVASDSFESLKGSDVIVVTSGEAQKPGQTRLDLVQKNKEIITELAKEIAPYVQDSVIVMVSNPVDVLTYHMASLLHLPNGRVIGTGTMLDSARFRFHLSEILHVHPRSIHAYILGEHGDSSFPAISGATVGGQPLNHFMNFSSEQAQHAYMLTRDAAKRIIQAKGATYYAIGVVITKLVKAILDDQRSVLPVSVPVENYYGQSGLAISVPCIVGRGGAEQVLKIQLSESEQEQFVNSCNVIRSAM